MYNFKEIKINDITEDKFNNFNDKLIFQTKEWINFILKTQKVTLILLEIYDGESFIGYFTGFLFIKFGIKIVGSPFKGWTTSYMGFNICDDIIVDRAELIFPLWAYLKKNYKCSYFEMVDRFITIEDMKKYNIRYELQESLGINLTYDVDSVFSKFTKHCRKHIKQFENRGATVVSVAPNDEFAELYYSQLLKVFKYQKLSPSYDLDRVKIMLNELANKHMLLCLKVLSPNGECIATSISFAFNGKCYSWGSTSVREGKDYLQSEGIRWYMMKHWISLNQFDYDMVGVREYKFKFNPFYIKVPRIIMTTFRPLIWGRNLAKKFYWLINKMKNIGK